MEGCVYCAGLACFVTTFVRKLGRGTWVWWLVVEVWVEIEISR